jgi:hypothetical protein
MRHYEIMASGTLPWFRDIESSPRTMMSILPKNLIVSGRDMSGVKQENKSIDFNLFDRMAYYEKVGHWPLSRFALTTDVRK